MERKYPLTEEKQGYFDPEQPHLHNVQSATPNHPTGKNEEDAQHSRKKRKPTAPPQGGADAGEDKDSSKDATTISNE